MIHGLYSTLGPKDELLAHPMYQTVHTPDRVRRGTSWPLAEKLLQDLCGEDAGKIEQALKVAQTSLQLHKGLWEGVLLEIEERSL